MNIPIESLLPGESIEIALLRKEPTRESITFQSTAQGGLLAFDTKQVDVWDRGGEVIITARYAQDDFRCAFRCGLYNNGGLAYSIDHALACLRMQVAGDTKRLGVSPLPTTREEAVEQFLAARDAAKKGGSDE